MGKGSVTFTLETPTVISILYADVDSLPSPFIRSTGQEMQTETYERGLILWEKEFALATSSFLCNMRK